MLFFRCMAALRNPVYRRDEGIKWWLVSYTVTMFSFVTVYTAMNLQIQSNSFIDNRQDIKGWSTPLSGPLKYQYNIRSAVLGLIPSIMFNLNNWLADGLLVCSLFDVVPLTRVSDNCSTRRSIVAILSTAPTSGLSSSPASCTSPLLVRI